MSTIKKKIIRRFSFQSTSSPGKFYETLVYEDGSMSCNCKGWTLRIKNGIRECIHTKRIAGDATVNESIAVPVSFTKYKVTTPKQSITKKKTEASPPTTVVLNRPRRTFNLEDE